MSLTTLNTEHIVVNVIVGIGSDTQKETVGGLRFCSSRDSKMEHPPEEVANRRNKRRIK